MENLTPQQIVAELDKHIVGQKAAKRSVAIALRNRYRRQQLSPEMRRDVLPKNILMIGPTGVGKTEIARRVARVLDAPFIKVEATRFTEAGYVGQDVETIVFDLLDTAIEMVHDQQVQKVQDRAEGLAKERLIAYLCQQLGGRPGAKRRLSARRRPRGGGAEVAREEVAPRHDEVASGGPDRTRVVEMLEQSLLDEHIVEIELSNPPFGFDAYDAGFSSVDLEGEIEGRAPGAAPAARRVRRVSVKEARRLLIRDEATKLVDFDDVIDQAIEKVEQSGVVFLDEVDKIAGPRGDLGPDVSGEGVQRDLLPIVEGTVVITRYGPVKTDHVLFIGAGAFYQTKPSDLIPEFQGRFPIRVELDALSKDDFRRILADTDSSLVRQTRALLATENVDLVFTDDALDEIAEVAWRVNESTDNIGARRLMTVLERVVEDISFEAPEHAGEIIIVDAEYVRERVNPLLARDNLARYIL